MSVDNADLEVVDLNYFSFWKIYFVAIAAHDMRLTFCGSQVLKPLDRLQQTTRTSLDIGHVTIVVSDHLPLLSRRFLGR